MTVLKFTVIHIRDWFHILLVDNLLAKTSDFHVHAMSDFIEGKGLARRVCAGQGQMKRDPVIIIFFSPIASFQLNARNSRKIQELCEFSLFFI